jgi:hypothetical protein
MRLAGLCSPWKVLPVLRRALFFRLSQAGQTKVITDLKRALWKVSLMLELKSLLLKRGDVRMRVLKALGAIVSMDQLNTEVADSNPDRGTCV